MDSNPRSRWALNGFQGSEVHDNSYYRALEKGADGREGDGEDQAGEITVAADLVNKAWATMPRPFEL